MAADTDLDSLADEKTVDGSTAGNPLKDAIANLGRIEKDGSEQDDEEVEDEDSQSESETEVEEEDEEKPEESDTEVEDQESEDEDEEQAEKPKGKAPKLSNLDIPMPNADGSKGPRGTGKITVEGLPQEAADAMRHFIKEAHRLPLVEEQLQVAQESAQIADFVEQDPFSAMVMISNARPDSADEFARAYFSMHPDKIVEFAKELDLENMTEREQKLLAKTTKRDIEDKAKGSYQQHHGSFSVQKQADRLLVTVQDLAQAANLSEDETEEFMLVSSKRLAKLFAQNPRITNREVVANLQPVLARYAKPVTPTPKLKAKDSKEAAKVFTAKAQKSQKFQVVGSGKSSMKPAGKVGKLPKGTSLTQAIRMVGSGKV
jgi:hypothetical protein